MHSSIKLGVMTKPSKDSRKYFPRELLNEKQYMNVFSICQVWQALRNEVTREILSRFTEDAVKYIDSILSHGTYRPCCPTPMDTSTPHTDMRSPDKMSRQVQHNRQLHTSSLT